MSRVPLLAGRTPHSKKKKKKFKSLSVHPAPTWQPTQFTISVSTLLCFRVNFIGKVLAI